MKKRSVIASFSEIKVHIKGMKWVGQEKAGHILDFFRGKSGTDENGYLFGTDAVRWCLCGHVSSHGTRYYCTGILSSVPLACQSPHGEGARVIAGQGFV